MSELNFTGSDPSGRRAEIRSTGSIDYRTGENGFSVFTWRDDGTGVYLWREFHGEAWPAAYRRAIDWLKGV